MKHFLLLHLKGHTTIDKKMAPLLCRISRYNHFKSLPFYLRWDWEVQSLLSWPHSYVGRFSLTNRFHQKSSYHFIFMDRCISFNYKHSFSSYLTRKFYPIWCSKIFHLCANFHSLYNRWHGRGSFHNNYDSVAPLRISTWRNWFSIKKSS